MSLSFSKKKLYGKRLVLELVNSDHLDFLVGCYQLDEFMGYYRLAQSRDIDVEKIRQHLDNKNQSKSFEWVIKRTSDDKDADELIGLASLADYRADQKRAEFLVGIIDPNNQTKGFAFEASLLVLEFAFQQLKLHKVISFVYGFNEVAQKNTLHLGFSQEAFFRKHYLNPRNNTFIDLYQNGLLEEIFFASKDISRWSMRLLGRDITKLIESNQKLYIDGVEYKLSDLSDNAKSQLQSLQMAEAEIKQLNMHVKLMQTARNVYLQALQPELPRLDTGSKLSGFTTLYHDFLKVQLETYRVIL